MAFEMTWIGKCFLTDFAFKWFFSRVYSLMLNQVWIVTTYFWASIHSSLGSRSNPKVKNHPETIWNLVWLCTVAEKNQFGKNFIGGPSRKFKNLAKKWKILKFFLILLTITLVSICTSKKILKFFIFWPNFWISSKVHR